MVVTSFILACCGFILSSIAFAIGIYSLVELRSFNKSTHNIQYIDKSNPISKIDGNEPEDGTNSVDRIIKKDYELYGE